MADYVERDGDWVLRPPGALDETEMFVSMLEVVDPTAIQKLCDDFINTPSGGAVNASPSTLLSKWVLMVNANIRKACSHNAGDADRGYMTERDVGFFVPIDFTDAGGNTSLAMLLPYLFVNNVPALLIGREIFGFPKLLGDIQVRVKPAFVDLVSTVTPVAGAEEVGVQRPVATLRTIDDGSPTICPPAAVPGMILALLAILSGELGIPTPTSGFANVPMVFLKQFRDVAVDGKACHQSITRGVGTIDNIRSLCGHIDANYEVTLPEYDSIKIAKNLGLGPGPTYQSSIAVTAELDFALGWGTEEWRAP